MFETTNQMRIDWSIDLWIQSFPSIGLAPKEMSCFGVRIVGMLEVSFPSHFLWEYNGYMVGKQWHIIGMMKYDITWYNYITVYYIHVYTVSFLLGGSFPVGDPPTHHGFSKAYSNCRPGWWLVPPSAENPLFWLSLKRGWPTPLKNMTSSVGMMTFPTYGTIKFMFQTTNQ